MRRRGWAGHPCPHFTDEHTEAHKGQSLTARKWQSLIGNLGLTPRDGALSTTPAIGKLQPEASRCCRSDDSRTSSDSFLYVLIMADFILPRGREEKP